LSDVFGDARWHPILWVVQMLSFPIDRQNELGVTCCPNQKHEGQPRITCLLFPKKNRWRCKVCGANGDSVDFVSLALRRTKLESARWVIRNCKLLPDWERFEKKNG
jgi:hypothetical protein